MTKRLVFVALAATLCALGCDDSSPTAPNNTNVVFTAQMQAANETGAVSAAESAVNGTVTITIVPTKDAQGNFTSGVATASVSMQGFPAGSTITLAHIHTGAAGVAGGILVPFVPSASIAVANGTASFSQTSNISGSDLTNIVNNPAGFYFNVHTAASPAGVSRGQLVRTQ